MRYVLAGFILLGCTGELVAPVPVTQPVSVLWFVGVCDRPVVWWLRTDPAIRPPVMVYMARTDSLALLTDSVVMGLRWMELDGAAQIVAAGEFSTGPVGRLTATCRSL
jgi:hypothetical protein